MVYKELQNPGIAIQRSDNTLTITAPPMKNISFIVFLVASTFIWILGEKIIISLIVTLSVLHGYDYFFLLWFICWTAIGFLLFLKLLWVLTGREIISLSSDSLIIEKKYLGIPRRKVFLLEGVKDIRVETNTLFRRRSGIVYSAFFRGFIKFSYGMKTVTFLSGVNEEDARSILEQILEHISKKRTR